MEIPISQDIRKYKTKDVGNFSFKEAGFIALGLGAAVVTYKLAGNSIEVALLPMMVIIAIGFLKPYGMSFFEFVRTVVADKLTPQTYINETDFQYNPDEFDELYENPIQVSPDWQVIQTQSSVKINKAEAARIIR